MECASEPDGIAAGLPAASFARRSRGGADRSHRAVPYLRRQLRSLGRHALGSVLAGLAVLVIGAPEQANAQTPNTAATGAPTITGTAQVGRTLTASPGTIADADGLTTPNYTYQWIRVDGTDEEDLTAATTATYTMNNADLGKTLKVRASFTDDAGNAESRTSAPTATVEYGAPTALSVTVGVGQVLLAWRRPAAGGLAFTHYEYRYSEGGMISPTAMWQQVQSASGFTPIQAYFQQVTGLTSGTTYTFQVRTATDVIKGAPATVIATPVSQPSCTIDDLGDRRRLWQGQLTAGLIEIATDGNIKTGYGDGAIAPGTLTPDAVTFRSITYSVGAQTSDDHLTVSLRAPDLTAWYPQDEVVDALRLHVCNTPYDFSSAATPGGFDEFTGYQWSVGSDWPPGIERTLRLSLPANNVATGEPAITGTAQAGQVLTADASPILDTDGLTGVDFTYQWLRVDADGTSNPADITDATAATYTPTAADAGKKVKVQVSFTDELSGEEERTSAAYPSSGTVTASANTTAPALLSVTVTSTPRKTTDTYGAREHIEFSMTFDAPVTVTGDPTFAFDLGGPSTATWYAGSGTTTLRFSHAVSGGSSGDRDTNGISWAENKIALNGGTIAGRDNAVAAVLTHAAQSNLAGHKVDGRTTAVTPATVTDVVVTSTPMLMASGSSTADTYGFGETIVITVTASEAVEVVGDPEFEFSLNNPGESSNPKLATYDRTRSTAMAMAFAYTVQAGDMDSDGIWIGSGSSTFVLDVNDRIRTASQQIDIDRSHPEKGTLAGHKVDGSLGAPTVPPDPTAPTLVSATATTLTIEWTHPGDGGSPLTRNFIEYRVEGTTDWTNWYRGETPTAVTRTVITNLAAATAYDVRVHATNAIGNSSWTQSATAFSTLAGTASCPVPTFTGRRKIWTAVLTMGDFTEIDLSLRGYDSNPESGDGGGLDPATFTLGSRDYDVGRIALVTSGANGLNFYAGHGQGEWWDSTVLALRLHVCNTNFDLSDSGYGYRDEDRIVIESNHVWTTDLDWSGVTTRTVHLSLPLNRPATGAPVITGPATVGKVLAVDVTGIEDEDGLHEVEYTYQWVRVDADGTSNEEDITDATADTYTLTDDDLGKKVKIEVSFPDDFGSDEQRTSAPTETVAGAPNTPATGAPTITGTAQVGETLTAVTTGIMDADGLTSVSYSYQWIRVDADGTSNPADITDETDATYTLVDADLGKKIKVRVTFVDDASHTETLTSAATATVGAVATGPPTVNDVAVTSTPASGTTYYLAGEVIEFTVTFSAPVTVTATPKFAFRLGAATRQAAYASGSGSAALVFARTVQAGEVDRNGISWNAIALALDGGTITQTGATTAASLTHAEQAPLEGHRVDAAPPMQVSASVHGMSLVLVYDEPLDPASMPATGAYTVTATVGATTTNPAVSEVSIYGIWVTLALDAAPAAGATVTLAYAPPASNPVQDEAGNDAPAFSGQSVRLGPPPPPVTNLAQVMGVGVVPGNAQLVVTWTAVDNATGYTVQWMSVGQGYNTGDRQATVTTGSTTRYTIPSLTNGTEYTGRVIATRTGASDGPPSAEVKGTPFTTPGAPQHLSGVPGDEQVMLTWDAPSSDGGSAILRYEYAIDDSGTWIDAGLDLEETVPGLTNVQQYAFEVRAVNSAGPGAPARTAATPLGMPSVPESLTATGGDGEVVLEWSAPADDGGAPVTGYEYRFAAGTAVPGDTPWQSAGLDLEWTVTGLTNGQQYAFEVRAVNSAGPGAAARTAATPLGMPSVPESLTATGGDGEVVLEWSAPADDGGSPVTGYGYRYAAGQAVPEDVTWRDAGTELTATVSGLENETRYAFEVRARNRVGPGETSGTTALPLRLRAELFSSAAAEGEALVVGVRRSGRLAFPAHAYIGVTDSALPGVTATDEGRDDGLGRQRLEFAAGAAESTVTVTVAFDGERRQDRVLSATLDSAELEVDGVRRPYELVTPTLVVPVTEGDAGLSVADARVQGKSSVLAFTVSLDRTRDVAVRVDYATEDGSARAGEDYTPVSGTLTIEAGGRERTVEVPVLPALHVAGERTLTLRLSHAVSAVIDDGVASGVIVRESELPKAWLARFGRTASDHAAQAIARRLEAGQRETQVTVAGRRVNGLSVDGLLSGALPSGGWRPASAVEDMATRLAAPALAASGAPFGGVDADPGTPGLRAGTWGEAPGALDREPFADAGQTLRRAVLPDFGFRLPGAEEALLGTSFYVERGAQQDVGGGTWAAWGDVAATRFEGDAGGLALDGDVVTGTAGLDRQWRAVLVGLALSRSSGEGGYGTGAGTIASTLTSVHPYMQVRLGERAQVWGAAGWGRGGLEITPESGAMLEADLTNRMGALGARAVLMGAGGLEIALRSDFLWTETASDGTAALAEAVGTASRGRLMLEGAGQIQGLGGVVRPKVEGGVRYDGGDAETGQGFEVGGGLDWARGSLTLQVNGRMLIAHADESYEEWGYSGSLVYEPGADGLGLQMRVGSSTGAAASGIRNLWALENASGLVRGGAVPFAQRFNAEVGYGLGRGTLWYPYFVADDSGRTRYGLKLSSGRTIGVGLEFGRRESVDLGPQDAMLLRGELRF